MSEPSAAVLAAIARQSGAQAAPDKLEQLRAAARELRDQQALIGDLEERTKAAKAAVQEIQMKRLPDLLQDAGVDSVGIPPEGNLPGYDGKLKPYYHANIAESWEPERRAAAFDWLEKNGHGDLIKVTVSAVFGRGDIANARILEDKIRQLGFQPELSYGVPWNTLTSWLREQIEKYGRTPPLDLFGATVGYIVKLVARKT